MVQAIKGHARRQAEALAAVAVALAVVVAYAAWGNYLLDHTAAAEGPAVADNRQ